MVLNPTVIIAIISSLIALTMGIALILISGGYPKTIKGSKEWGIAYLILSASMPISLLRGIAPDFIGAILANFLILVAYTLMYFGSVRFLKRSLLGRNQIILVLTTFLLILIWLTYQTFEVEWSGYTLSIYCAFMLSLQIILFRDAPKSLGRTLVLIALILILIGQFFRVISVSIGWGQTQNIFDISIPLITYLLIPAILIPLATIGFILLLSEEYNQSLTYISRHDSLTGCLNKKTFIELLEDQIRYTKRYKNKLSVIMMDLNDFKSVNDQFGHLVGDHVLVDFVNQAKTCLRETDQLARFGGDEFIAILPNTDIVQARSVANRIYELGGSGKIVVSWSVSTGVGEWIDDQDTFEGIITRADRDLYKSKSVQSQQSKE